MLPNATAVPTSGAYSVRPVKPWQIYIFRGEQWVPVGACATRALAESQLTTLRKLMRGHKFAIAWEDLEGAA
ncbi:MAG: hypothetical protein WBG32_00115 [Nodosilinea sp.]